MIPALLFLKPVGAFLKGVPWQVWAGIGLVAAGLFYGHLRYNAGQASVQGKFDAYRAQMQAKTAEAAKLAKAAEVAQRSAIAAAVAEYKKDQDDAKAKGAAVAAGVRDGSVRLRDHWQGCPVSAPAGDPGRRDERAELRADAAGRIVGAGASADAQVKALQAIIRSAPHCFKVPQ